MVRRRLSAAVAVGMAADSSGPPDSSRIRFQAPETTVTGTVTDPEGQPVAGARVTEYQTDRVYVTDARGTFTSAFPVSAPKRHFTAVHKQRALVGYGLAEAVYAPAARASNLHGPFRAVFKTIVSPTLTIRLTKTAKCLSLVRTDAVICAFLG